MHHWLLKMPPEVAHRMAGRYISALCLLPHIERPPPAILIPSIPRLKFHNRLGLAAGFDKNGTWAKAMDRIGFGFVEVGTVTPLPQVGNLQPRLWRFPDALVNKMGFNNCGVSQFLKNLRRYKRGVPVFANIGKGVDTPIDRAIDDYAICIQALKRDVDGFVVNISSPNTKNLRSLQSLSFIDQLIPMLPRELPVWLKLAPDLDKTMLTNLFDRINESPAITGVVLTNTSRELAKRLYNFDEGGLSGKPLFEKALECIALARGHLKPTKSIIGVGGVSSSQDALKMREAGADLVEIYTGFIYGGLDLVHEISSALKN